MQRGCEDLMVGARLKFQYEMSRNLDSRRAVRFEKQIVEIEY